MLPSTYRRVVATYLSTDFTKCTKVETVPMPTDLAAALKPTEVLVRNHFAGINASDINYTAGRYRPNLKPPFACGMEAMGEVVGIHPSTTATATGAAMLKVGTPVVTSDFGGFSEYQIVSTRFLRQVPRIDPRLLALEISGVTASIALEQVGQPVAGETALVTAAAGGTGIFAVQLLKKVYGCKCVIGTCSSSEKAEFLKKMGCDEVVNYKEQDLGEVLAKRKGGVNLVYESVGGKMLDAALDNIAIRGRIVTIGGITAYSSGADWASGTANATRIPQILLGKSASLRGFFLPHFKKMHEAHFQKLVQLVDDETIESCVDETKSFEGIESVADAVEHLHSGKNMGKVVVKF